MVMSTQQVTGVLAGTTGMHQMMWMVAGWKTRPPLRIWIGATVVAMSLMSTSH